MKFFAPLLPILLLTSCGQPEHVPSPAASLPSVAVKTHTARIEPYLAMEEVVGSVRSKHRAQVEAKVSGRVMEYRAAPGQKVKAGDILARLEVQEVQAKLDQAKAMLDQAQRDFERQKQLITSQATTRQEFDAAEAKLKIARAGVTEAETLIGYARVTAPFDGVVTRKLADVGDLAMPGKVLLELEAPSDLRFEADLPEAMLDRVSLGAAMKIKVASMPESLEGRVSEIAPIADPVSRTFQVKWDLAKVEGLRTGQFGRVRVPMVEIRQLLVPAAAVMKRGQMEVVFVVKDNHAVLRLTKTGKQIDDRVEVLSGLEEGEAVIVGDIARLQEGQPVTIQP